MGSSGSGSGTDWGSVASGAGSLAGSFIPEQGTTKAQYGFQQSPEMASWLNSMEGNYNNMAGNQNAYTNSALGNLAGQYAVPSNYLAGILGGNQLTPDALNKAYQPYINAANVANQGAVGNVASQMNKAGVGGSTATAGMMSSAQNANNAALGQQLAGLTQAAQQRQMQAAQLSGQLPGMEANSLATILGSQQGMLGQGYNMRGLMPQLERTQESQQTGPTGGLLGNVLPTTFGVGSGWGGSNLGTGSWDTGFGVW